MRHLAITSLAALACGLASCAGTQPGQTIPAAASDRLSASHHKVEALVRIEIPKKRKSRRPRADYVSPSTQSIAITVSPEFGSPQTFNANLTPATNPNCSQVPRVCTIQLALEPGRYTAALATFDGLLNNQGVPTGNELSANQGVPLTIVLGKSNGVNVTLGGIPASVAFVPSASSTLTGNATSGYQLPRCSASAQKVSIFGVDADGNFILGSGAPRPSLASNNAAVVVSTPSPATPNQFVLTPPTPPEYVYPGTTLQLTAKVAPAGYSGGASQSAIVDFAFTSDICGVVTEYPIPTASSGPLGITVGPDNAVWFTERFGNQIGRIPVTATVERPQVNPIPVPSSSTGPEGDRFWCRRRPVVYGMLNQPHWTHSNGRCPDNRVSNSKLRITSRHSSRTGRSDVVC